MNAATPKRAYPAPRHPPRTTSRCLNAGPGSSAALLISLALALGGCDSPGGGGSGLPGAGWGGGWGDAGGRADGQAEGDAEGSPERDAITDTDGAHDRDTTTDTGAPPADTQPSGPRAVGVGVLIGEVDSAFLNLAFARARLTRASPPPDTSGTLHGVCRVLNVDPDAQSTDSYGLDAGILTVTGTTPPVTFSPVDEGVFGTGYAASLPDDQQDLLPSGGAILTIQGAGGADIAAFTGALQAPEPVTISLPRTGLNAEVDPTRDLTVLWNQGTGDSVLVSLSPVDAMGAPVAGKAAFCLVAGDPGSLEVPSTALIELAGPGTPMMALGVTRTRSSAALTAAHQIPLSATRSSGGPVRLSPP